MTSTRSPHGHGRGLFVLGEGRYHKPPTPQPELSGMDRSIYELEIDGNNLPDGSLLYPPDETGIYRNAAEFRAADVIRAIVG